MPHLRPFRGLRYDSRAIPRLGDVLCPPYDVISPAQREAYAARDPHNAVHVELPAVSGGMPDYDGAARTWAGWQAHGVVRRDDVPSVYAYEQTYRLPDGSLALARGLYCLLRLEPFGPASGVRPHERTMSAPKEDRYRLLRAVRANLSPVLMLYDAGSDAERAAALLDELCGVAPDLDATAADGVGQRLWAIDPAKASGARELLALAGREPMTIADGHHRYETALRFAAEQTAPGEASGGEPAGDAGRPHDWVLVLLFEAATSGLAVLPTHRFVEARRAPAEVLAAARELFAVGQVGSVEEVLAGLREPGRLGLWSSAGCALLEPRRERIEPLLPAGATDALRWLDVTVLTSALPAVVGESAAELLDAGRLFYVKDSAEVLAQAAAAARGYAFLLPPTPVAAVLQIAGAGEQMPHKSTYFEPKPATGLVFNSVAA